MNWLFSTPGCTLKLWIGTEGFLSSCHTLEVFVFPLDDFLSGETELWKGSSFSKSKRTFQIFI